MPGEANLIPIKLGGHASTAKEVKSEKKNFANVFGNSKIAKCKRCKVVCDFKEINMKKNPECTCVCPHARATAIVNDVPISVKTPEIIEANLNDVIHLLWQYYGEDMKEIAESIRGDEIKKKRKSKIEKIRRGLMMFNTLLQYKDKMYPAVRRVEADVTGKVELVDKIDQLLKKGENKTTNQEETKDESKIPRSGQSDSQEGREKEAS